jgi:hypothetical protein
MEYFRVLCSIALAFALLAPSSCRAEASVSFERASALLNSVSGASVRPYSTRDFGREKFAGAISVLIDPTKAEGMLAALRKELPAGFVAFIGTTQSLTKPAAAGAELVIGRGSGPIDILHIAQTDAVNYDMSNSDLKRRLMAWHKAYGIDIWQAETDTIQLRFNRMPRNVHSFAEEVYKFCPDTVDQGVGTKNALVKDIRERKGLYLWWD